MPAYYPEVDAPVADDTPFRSWQKIVSRMLNGGLTPPVSSNLISEESDNLITEEGDNLITQP